MSLHGEPTVAPLRCHAAPALPPAAEQLLETPQGIFALD